MLEENQPAQRGLAGEVEGSPEPEAGAAEREAPKQGSRARSLLAEILQTVLLTLLIFMAVRAVVQNYEVDGISMEPTLQTGQRLLVNRMAYLRVEGWPLDLATRAGLYDGGQDRVYPFGRPQRGDIIVFTQPLPPYRDLVKRVIAVPGDTVQIERGRVYLNGNLLEEDYIRALPTYSVARQEVPEGKYFVLGDNRSNSSDSHIWGLVPEANIIGRVWLSYWPPSRWGAIPAGHAPGN